MEVISPIYLTSMERALEDAKGERSLGDYEIRGWRDWHPYMSMTPLNLLFLRELQVKWGKKKPYLTAQDIREILEGDTSEEEVTPEEILHPVAQKYKARLSARRSHH